MVAIHLLSREETAALGWTLVHFLWQGTVIALAFAFVDQLTRRASTALRYLVALGAFALMPLAVIATFANELHSRPASPERSALPVSAAAVLNFNAHPQIVGAIAPDLPPAAHRSRTWLAGRLEPALPWIDGLWILGVSLFALRAMGGWCHLHLLRRRARWFIPADLQDQFDAMCRKMNLGRQITLRISEEVISPLAMGAWRATIILPVSAVLRIPPAELEAVLAHELGHIRRADYLCNLFQTAVESVLFFHPAVWWLSRTLRERREICCDEIAVSVCADPLVYAQALLRLEEQKTARLHLAVALKGSNGSLLRRVKHVLGDERIRETRTTAGVRAATAAILVLGLLFGPRARRVIAAPLINVTQASFNRVGISLAAKPSFDTTGTPGSVASSERPAAHASPASRRTANAQVQVEGNTAISTAFGPANPATSMAFSSKNNTAVVSSSIGLLQAGDASRGVGNSAEKGSTYIEQMHAAGYPLDLNHDLDELVALKSLGVTPEYAKSMANLGFGKPSLQELISLKSLGVTPEYIASVKQNGMAPKDLNEAVSEKALGVTPEYALAMKKAGFGEVGTQELIALKAQGMTSEYAGWLKQQFPQATTDELQRAAVFHIDDSFIAKAKSHGFDAKDFDKLLKLKMSGLLDE